MFTLSSDVLSLSDEAAALLLNRRLVYANAAALAILGPDCAGKEIRALFGEEVAAAQQPQFAASVPLGGKNRLLRVCREGNMQVVFIARPEEDAALFSEAYLQALRSGLMNLRLAASAGRRRAEEQGDEALLQSFAGLNREYFRLNRLLANISAARGVVRGELPVTLSTVDLGAMIAELTDSVGLLRPDVALEFTARQRVLLWADPQLLELMLMNLVSNCLLHAEGLRRIRIELEARKDRVYLSVRDDGCGIPPENLASVFRRYRAELPIRELPRGAGLGMTVIRGVAEAHGGTLLLESREGVGTSLRISLSRALMGDMRLREEAAPFAPGMDRLLTGLAPCLPDRCFLVRYGD